VKVQWSDIPEPLLWSLAVHGLGLVVLLCLLCWVMLSMWTEDY
jgi:hypothetical protein